MTRPLHLAAVRIAAVFVSHAAAVPDVSQLVYVRDVATAQVQTEF